MTLKKTLASAALLLLAGTTLQAQTNRRDIETLAARMVSQATYAGQRPADEQLAQLVAVAQDGLFIVCRTHEAGDERGARACLRVVEATVDYAIASADEAAISRVRAGLKKAIDRSDSQDERLQLMAQLQKCATQADAPYFEQYLTDPQTAPLASQALIALPGIDARIDSLVAATKPADPRLLNIQRARRGEQVTVAAPAVVRRQVKKDPFWTDRLDSEVARLASQPCAEADTATTLASLLSIAALQPVGEKRDAVLARYLTRVAAGSFTGTERYLLLREADQLEPGDELRQKLITDLGQTCTIQALAYLRQYYDSPTMDDATSVALVSIIRATPEALGGRHVRNMLNAAKFALARHYDEQGAVEAIDDVLAAIDECPERGYDFDQSATSMGKKGFWKMQDDLADFSLTFDWNTPGRLTVELRSMPIVEFDRQQGVRVAGMSSWQAVGDVDAWRTCAISVNRSQVSVSVNGHEVCHDQPLCNPEPGMPVRQSGYIGFAADEQGADVRQVCIRRN